MYKLLIKDKFLNWKTADLGDDKPAMNYQSNNIAELKDRQASYSQALKLPRTQNNCLIFDHSDSSDVVTDFPYQKHNCRLFCNDFILAGPGSFLILDKKTEFFEVQILSGNADFFTLLNQPMSNLDLGSIVRNLASFNPANFGTTYEFAAATFTKVAETFFRTDLDDMFPFVLLKPIIENILKSNGYNLPDGVLVTDLTDAQWNKKALSLCSLTPGLNSFDSFNAHSHIYGSGSLSEAYYMPMTIDNSGNAQLTGDSTGNNYVSSFDCKYRFKFQSTGYNVGRKITINISNTTQGVTLLSLYDFVVGSIGEVYIFDQIIEVAKNDIIRITVLNDNPGLPAAFTNTLDISEVYADQVPLNGVLPFAQNIGFDNQIDLFKAFVQLFGLTVSVDNENKIVSAYTMQKLYDNKPIAKDWSAKLHNVRSNEMNYVLLNSSYAQSNVIKFEDNTDDNVKDSGFFTIPNNTLQVTKDLFSLKLGAGFDRQVLNWIVANIPLNEITVDGLTTTFKGGKPHIVDLSTDTIEFVVYGSMFYYHKATHAKVQSFIDTFYPELITILSSAKYMIDEFFLTDKDIEDFDQFTPVFVQKYGAYFYINIINNYISKHLTKVELIKL